MFSIFLPPLSSVHFLWQKIGKIVKKKKKNSYNGSTWSSIINKRSVRKMLIFTCTIFKHTHHSSSLRSFNILFKVIPSKMTVKVRETLFTTRMTGWIPKEYNRISCSRESPTWILTSRTGLTCKFGKLIRTGERVKWLQEYKEEPDQTFRKTKWVLI